MRYNHTVIWNAVLLIVHAAFTVEALPSMLAFEIESEGIRASSLWGRVKFGIMTASMSTFEFDSETVLPSSLGLLVTASRGSSGRPGRHVALEGTWMVARVPVVDPTG